MHTISLGVDCAIADALRDHHGYITKNTLNLYTTIVLLFKTRFKDWKLMEPGPIFMALNGIKLLRRQNCENFCFNVKL